MNHQSNNHKVIVCIYCGKAMKDYARFENAMQVDINKLCESPGYLYLCPDCDLSEICELVKSYANKQRKYSRKTKRIHNRIQKYSLLGRIV